MGCLARSPELDIARYYVEWGGGFFPPFFFLFFFGSCCKSLTAR